MPAVLKSISVTDFRSIKGTVVIPMDAPVVLVHGQNGSGKTSLLSALELALTGHVPSLRRVDADYESHLVHKDAPHARVELSVSGAEIAQGAGVITVTAGKVAGAPLFPEDLSRFFNERCFLAQSTLGRLLELYEDKDTQKTPSSLTRFVKDLLGLDQLDALIDGLYDAGDVRRFRASVPYYRDARDRITALQGRLTARRADLAQLLAEEAIALAKVLELIEPLGVYAESATDLEKAEQLLRASTDDGDLEKLFVARNQVRALSSQWADAATGPPAGVRNEIEAEMGASERALQAWTSTEGVRLEHAVAGVRELISEFRIRANIGPEAIRADALQIVTSELTRCNSVLAQSAADELRLEELNRDMERARARAELLDKQIGDHAAAAGQLATLLTAMLEYVQSNECPVCGRDFGESSERALHVHVSERIAALTESSGRLQALTRERVASANTLTAAERQRDILIGRRLESQRRDELKTRNARLAEVQLLLTSLAAVIREGQRCVDATAKAAQSFATLRNRDQRANAVRSSVAQMAVQLSIDPLNETEPVEEALRRIESVLAERIESITVRVTARRVALSETRKAIDLRQKRTAIEKGTQEDVASLKHLESAKDKADTVVRDARELAKLAREARTETVRRVFNDSLNALWRDLFLRLAPDEPFVPAFALPDVGSTTVEATLETHHRSGGKGGNPRAMLSAGNLNTAALTLFLALHLSVTPRLPWLVIDDPVQSMDEVHVAQFAALLRTLSKSLKRQIIIAVHERPLFEYLALELNPAFPEDRLITVELGRNADGTTVMRYEPIIWTPDNAIAA